MRLMRFQGATIWREVHSRKSSGWQQKNSQDNMPLEEAEAENHVFDTDTPIWLWAHDAKSLVLRISPLSSTNLLLHGHCTDSIKNPKLRLWKLLMKFARKQAWSTTALMALTSTVLVYT